MQPPAREGEKPEPGGIFRLGDAGLPAALAEGQQDRGIGDPRAVVGEGNAGAIALLPEGNGNTVGAAPARVLQGLGENIGEAGRKQSGHLVDGAGRRPGRGLWRELSPGSDVPAFCAVDMGNLLIVDAGMKSAPPV